MPFIWHSLSWCVFLSYTWSIEPLTDAQNTPVRPAGMNTTYFTRFSEPWVSPRIHWMDTHPAVGLLPSWYHNSLSIYMQLIRGWHIKSHSSPWTWWADWTLRDPWHFVLPLAAIQVTLPPSIMMRVRFTPVMYDTWCFSVCRISISARQSRVCREHWPTDLQKARLRFTPEQQGRKRIYSSSLLFIFD